MNSYFKHFLFDTPQKKVPHSGVFSETTPFTPPKILPMQGSIEFFPFSPKPNTQGENNSSGEELPPQENRRVFSLQSLAPPNSTSSAPVQGQVDELMSTGFSPVRPFATPMTNKSSYCVDNDESRMLFQFRPLIQPPPHMVQYGPPTTNVPARGRTVPPISGEDVLLKPNIPQPQKQKPKRKRAANKKKSDDPQNDGSNKVKPDKGASLGLGGSGGVLDDSNLVTTLERRYVLRNVIPPKKRMVASPKFLQARITDAKKRRSKQRGYRYEEDEDFVMNNGSRSKRKKKRKKKKKSSSSSDDDYEEEDDIIIEKKKTRKTRKKPKNVTFSSPDIIINNNNKTSSSTTTNDLRVRLPPPIPDRLSKNPYEFTPMKPQQPQRYAPSHHLQLQRQPAPPPEQYQKKEEEAMTMSTSARILLNSPPPPKSLFKTQHQQERMKKKKKKKKKKVNLRRTTNNSNQNGNGLFSYDGRRTLKNEHVYSLQKAAIQRREQLHQNNRQRAVSSSSSTSQRFEPPTATIKYSTSMNTVQPMMINQQQQQQPKRKRKTTTAIKKKKKKKKKVTRKKKEAQSPSRKSTMGTKQKLPRKKMLELARKVDVSEKKLREKFHMNNKKHLRGTLPKKVLEELKTWFIDNRYKPYPTTKEKEALMETTGLSKTQIEDWFTNKRKRVWKPLVEELLAENGVEY